MEDRRGVQDFIGAARPSIADPYLPAKIREGRADESRECIGCNICRAANNEAVGLRCTQNPTMGEEWRKGWHPERIARHAGGTALVVGAGPAGLEAALTLGRRGLEVSVAFGERVAGGRVNRESTLPGLATWGRVREWRLTMLAKLPNVTLFAESGLTAQDVLDFGADHVVLATGSVWRRDGIGVLGMTARDFPGALTPDDVFAGAEVKGSVVIYDDEHYFMGGALAEKLALAGHAVTDVTPPSLVSAWTVYTDEQTFIQARLVSLGVRLKLGRDLLAVTGGEAVTGCAHTGQVFAPLACDTLVLVTGRVPVDGLYAQLVGKVGSLARVGDCLAPSSMADAIYAAHRFARELGEGAVPLRREMPPHRAAL